MNYKTEVLRAKDGGYRTWTNETDGTEKELKKIRALEVYQKIILIITI